MAKSLLEILNNNGFIETEEGWKRKKKVMVEIIPLEKKQSSPVEYPVSQIKSILEKYSDEYTISINRGFYRDEANLVIIRESFELEDENDISIRESFVREFEKNRLKKERKAQHCRETNEAQLQAEKDLRALMVKYPGKVYEVLASEHPFVDSEYFTLYWMNGKSETFLAKSLEEALNLSFNNREELITYDKNNSLWWNAKTLTWEQKDNDENENDSED